MPAQPFDLLTAADAEPGTYRERRARAYTIEVAEHRIGHRHALARRAGHGDGVHEPLAARAQLRKTPLLRDRRDHLHQRKLLRIERRAQLAALIERQVRDYEPRHASLGRRSCQALGPEWG